MGSEEAGRLLFIHKNGANIKQTKDVDGFPITRIETLAGGILIETEWGMQEYMIYQNIQLMF